MRWPGVGVGWRLFGCKEACRQQLPAGAVAADGGLAATPILALAAADMVTAGTSSAWVATTGPGAVLKGVRKPLDRVTGSKL